MPSLFSLFKNPCFSPVAAGILSSWIVVGSSPSFAEIISVGSGSYTTERPELIKPLPEKIYKTDALRGATPSNQWWSSLLWNEFSQNMFPHPLAMVCYEEGLSLSYPGSGINAGSDIMGGGVSKNGDIVIGHSEIESFSGAKCAGYSQWFITAEFKAEASIMRTHFGHGSPFVFCELEGGSPQVRFAETPKIWAGGKNDAVLGVTVRGNHYGIFGASGSSWSGQGSEQLTNEESRGYFSVALLPDKEKETLKLFSGVAHNHVIGTRAVPSFGKGTIDTT